MKGNLIFQCILSVLLTGPLSYSANGQKLSCGPKVGILFSNYNYLQGKSSPNAGLQIGAEATCILTDVHAVRAVLLHEQRGYRNDEPIDTRITYRYIVMPLAYNPAFGVSRAFSLLLGGQVGYLLSGKTIQRGTVNNIYIDTKDKHDLADYNRFDFSVVLGCAASISILKNKRMNIEIRYQRSLNSINKKDTALVYPRHHGLSLGVCLYLFSTG